jgi:hypothetical protein
MADLPEAGIGAGSIYQSTDPGELPHQSADVQRADSR